MAPARPLAKFRRGVLGRIAAVTALACAALAFAVEIWAVAPAPTLGLLALAVIVPELAPWGVAICSVVLCWVACATRGAWRVVGVAVATAALICAAYPLVLVPSAVSAANDELQRLTPLVEGTAGAFDARISATPFDLRVSFAGFPPVKGVRTDLALPVRTRDGTLLALDLYRTGAEGARPAIVLIYGGAWIFGSRSDMAEIARSFAGLGYTVIAIDYRHAPRYPYPTQLHDVEDALATIARNARAWNVDVRRVALFGRSAGAELALLAAYRPQPLRIRAAVAYYAPTDLVRGYLVPPKPDPADVRAILRAYIGGSPRERHAAYVAASPVTGVRPHLPTTLLAGGERDELIRFSLQSELRDALRAAGDPVVSIDLPWSNHAFDTLSNDVGGQIARYYTQRFLRAVL